LKRFVNVTIIVTILLLTSCPSAFFVPTVKATKYAAFDYPWNHCLNFTSTANDPNERLDCGQHSIYQSAQLSIEAWIKPTYNVQSGSDPTYGDAWGTIACLRQQSAGSRGGWWFGFNYHYGNLTFIIDWNPGTGWSDTEIFSNKTNWSYNSWYYVAVTYDPTLAENNLVFYVNGTVDSYHNSTAAIVYGAPTLQIGSQANTPIFYDGLLDEMRLWNVSRTQTEIQNTWDWTLNDPNETATAYPYLVGYWHFDNVTNGNYLDYSIYHNDAVPSTPGPQLVALGAPIITVPEFSSTTIIAVVMTIGTLCVLLLRRRVRATQSVRKI
jgi:hypothetical protein